MFDASFESDLRQLGDTLNFLAATEDYQGDKALMAYGRSMGYLTTTAMPFFAVEATGDDDATDVAKTKADAANRLAEMQGRFEASLTASDHSFADLSADVEKKTSAEGTKLKVAPAAIAAVVGAVITAKEVLLSMTERARINQAEGAGDVAKGMFAKLKAKLPSLGGLRHLPEPEPIPEPTKTLIKRGLDAGKEILRKMKLIKPDQLVSKKIIPTAWEAATPKQRIMAAAIVFSIYSVAAFIITHVVLKMYRWIKSQLA